MVVMGSQKGPRRWLRTGAARVSPVTVGARVASPRCPILRPRIQHIRIAPGASSWVLGQGGEPREGARPASPADGGRALWGRCYEQHGQARGRRGGLLESRRLAAAAELEAGRLRVRGLAGRRWPGEGEQVGLGVARAASDVGRVGLRGRGPGAGLAG